MLSARICLATGTSKPWLDSVVRGDAQFGLSPLTLSAVARIVTNPRVFEEPSPIAEAFAFCDNLLGQPHCQVVRPGSGHWTIFTRICLEFGRSRASNLRRLVCGARH